MARNLDLQQSISASCDFLFSDATLDSSSSQDEKKASASVRNIPGTMLIMSLATTSASPPPNYDHVKNMNEAYTSSGFHFPSENSQELVSPDLLFSQKQQSQRERLLRIKRKSGLTWVSLATIFEVSKRTLHLWAAEENISESNLVKLSNVEESFRNLDGIEPSRMRAWLLAKTSEGFQPIELLAQNRFSDFKREIEKMKPGFAQASSDSRKPRAEYFDSRPSPFDILESVSTARTDQRRPKRRIVAKRKV